MTNKGITPLSLWIKDGVEVGPAAIGIGATEVRVEPGQEIPVSALTAERIAFFTATGHIQPE